jgi:hypothetical protein
VYRVILTTEDEFVQKTMQLGFQNLLGNNASVALVGTKSEKENNSNNLEGLLDDCSPSDQHDILEGSEPLALASVSSAMSSHGSTFKKMIQDFKKALGERKTPRDLSNLNRIIMIFIVITIILSIV